MADECTCWELQDDYCDFCGMLGGRCTFCFPDLEDDYDYEED